MDQKSDKPSQKRRAILQGSLAAPVVLTVPSPSAATQTTLGRCLANLDNGPQPAFLVADTSPPVDTWLRVQVPVVKLVEPNSTVICEAFRDGALSGPVPYRYITYPYAQVQLDTNQLKTFSVVETNTNLRGLQWVDETYKTTSTKIQLETPGSGYRHATGTCWSSFVRSA